MQHLLWSTRLTFLPQVFAHSLPDPDMDRWETLQEHLAGVGNLAAENGSSLGLQELSRVAGHLHDVGKASAVFQAYIRGDAERGGDHATAGAQEAICHYGANGLGRWLALVIAGHHSGLTDADTLDRRLGTELPDYTGWQAHAPPLPAAAALRPTRPQLGPPRHSPEFSLSFAVRMLFSCLVDADFIATETFMAGGQRPRGMTASIETLQERLGRHLAALRGGAEPSALNGLRTEILEHAVAQAGTAPGFFTLTVPTGGGKTLTSLAFALAHAEQNGKRRVVVVIPFTAIIEQTADIYRTALGDDAVLEHHSSFDWEERARVDDDGGRLRRTAENWDAPVVVTTAVQFFESLFANRTSRCRKLHNLADSVIVLDEAQTTPPDLLLPCLAALDELRRAYGASIVLCTATQPAWRLLDAALVENLPSGKQRQFGLDIPETRELAPRPAALAIALRRTRVEVLPDPVDDAALAAAFAQAPRMLCIVNSRAHARAVFERIRHMEGAAHLTTLMCPVHRRSVLKRLRADLRSSATPVRVVATSLIEAGVDISFPEVWRAAAGLDSIAQAAGRCNREGELLPALGRVVVFHPADAPAPRSLRAFQQAAAPILRDAADPLAPDGIGGYFRLLYAQKGMAALDARPVHDLPGILPAIARGGAFRTPFESVAQAFRMIDETMLPVIVSYDDHAETLLHRLAAPDAPARSLLRQLQGYTVGIPEAAWRNWLGTHLLPINRDLGETVVRLDQLRPLYDDATGLDLSDGAYRKAEANLW